MNTENLNINTIHISGCLIDDAKYNRTKENQVSVSNFKILNKRTYETKEGNWKIDYIEIGVVCWLKNAEESKGFKKGDWVYVEGYLKGTPLEIVAMSIQAQ